MAWRKRKGLTPVEVLAAEYDRAAEERGVKTTIPGACGSIFAPRDRATLEPIPAETGSPCPRCGEARTVVEPGAEPGEKVRRCAGCRLTVSSVKPTGRQR